MGCVVIYYSIQLSRVSFSPLHTHGHTQTHTDTHTETHTRRHTETHTDTDTLVFLARLTASKGDNESNCENDNRNERESDTNDER